MGPFRSFLGPCQAATDVRQGPTPASCPLHAAWAVPWQPDPPAAPVGLLGLTPELRAPDQPGPEWPAGTVGRPVPLPLGLSHLPLAFSLPFIHSVPLRGSGRADGKPGVAQAAGASAPAQTWDYPL